MTSKLILDVDDVAEQLGCGRSFVYYLVQGGRLRSARIGRRLAFRPEWIDGYLDDDADRRAATRSERVRQQNARAEALPQPKAVRRRQPAWEKQPPATGTRQARW